MVDEPDVTFFTDTQASLYLDIGYGQFRRAVANIDPLVFAKTQHYTISSAREINLTSVSPAILGNSVSAGNRMLQLVALEAVASASDTADVVYEFRAVGSPQAMLADRFTYALRGQKIVFGSETSETVRVTYLPEHTITWSSASNPVDDLTMFHDLIALYAYSQYAMRDGADSAPVQRQIDQRFAEMVEYVQARNLESASYVARVGWDDHGWL